MADRTDPKPLDRANRTQLLSLMIFGLAALLPICCAVCQTSAAAKRDGERLLEEGRTTLEVQTLTAARGAFEACVRLEDKNSVCYYDLARTAFYLGKAEELRKNKEMAEQWRDSAITDARHSIALNDRFSDAHALLADLYGAKISGMLSGMRYGPKANAEIQRAFQLAPNNPRAFAVVGRKYLYAPSMFGGDLDRAIDSFKKATTFGPQYDEAFVWLAIAFHKKRDSQQAQAAVAEALRLNSRSVFAIRVKSGAED